MKNVSRRGFLGTIGAAAAVTALPASALAAGTTATVKPGAAPLDAVRSWYTGEVDRIVRAWDLRFRFEMFRPDAEDDWEGVREAPRERLADALAALPMLRDGATACLVLAATSQEQDDTGTPQGQAAMAMAQDALAHAERLGYFTPPCPESLRFPDLPELDDRTGDLERIQREAESVRNCAALLAGIVDRDTARGCLDPADVTKRDEYRATAEALEARLAGMRAGTVPALTERQKVEAWQAERLAIVAAYRRQLKAAGVDASWAELPTPYEIVRLDEREEA